jgi:hypothetical protein
MNVIKNNMNHDRRNTNPQNKFINPSSLFILSGKIILPYAYLFLGMYFPDLQLRLTTIY